MPSFIFSISSLLFGIGILLVGNGMLTVLLGVKTAEEFGVGIAGIVMGGYFLGFLGGSFLVPRIIHAVGYIRTFAATAALASVAALAHGAVLDPALWWLLRVISGGCLVGVFMVVESWLNAEAPSGRRGRLLSIYMIVTLLALGLGLLLVPVVGTSTGLEAFAIASVFYTLGLIPVAITPVHQPQPVAAPSSGFRRLFAVSPTGFLGAVIAGMVNGVFWGLGPAFWSGLGMAIDEVSFFMAVVIAGGVLFQWPIGHLSDGRDRRKVLAAVCLGAAAAALLLTTASLSKVLLAIYALTYGGLMFTLYSLSVAHVNDRVSQLEILEAARTLLLLYGGGAAFGPVAAGPLMGHFGPAMLPLLSAVLLALMGAVTIQQMLRHPRVSAQDQGVFVPLTRTSQVALSMLPEAPAPSDEAEKERQALLN